MTAGYYLAARFNRGLEMRVHAERIEAVLPGAVVTSHWHDEDQPQQDFDESMLREHPEAAWPMAYMDLDDVADADTLVCFTYGGGGRGGRHVEFGYFLCLANLHSHLHRRIALIGPREHIFHCHPAVAVFADFDSFLRAEGQR